MSRYVFGPVPSRRLGRSLGVDLVPFKACSYDCIYCQLGRTTAKTIDRKEWVPLTEVVEELRNHLSSNPDYITLSGSGEPTLHCRVGELIALIKEITDIPVAVLTNGSLLWQEDVRRGLLGADLVIPSLDAGDETTFRLVNRPYPAVSFEQMLDGLIRFRQQFRGQYWLEVFILDGITTTPAELSLLAECVRRIRPDRVQLNTVTRPPAEKYAVGVSPERLAELSSVFEPAAEVVADFHGVHRKPEFAAGRDEILALLRRRPCSVDDIAGGLGMHRNEVIKYIEELAAENLLDQSLVADGLYYKVAKGRSI
jgi:wyosine [tRNA(Phe)-imidazoG37] synthetase (radical SAM superfamily)